AACGERVRGRAGRRRDDDAVAPEGRQRPAVDLDDDLDHALPVGLLDGRLVEGPAREDVALGCADRDLADAALLDLVVAGPDALDGGAEVLALGLGEEPDVAEVDAEDGDVGAAGELGRAQDRAVAAEDDDDLGGSDAVAP